MRAVGGLVHAMAFLQKFEKFLHGNPGIRRATQSEDLPHQDSKRPAEEWREEKHHMSLKVNTQITHTH